MLSNVCRRKYPIFQILHTDSIAVHGSVINSLVYGTISSTKQIGITLSQNILPNHGFNSQLLKHIIIRRRLNLLPTVDKNKVGNSLALFPYIDKVNDRIWKVIHKR